MSTKSLLFLKICIFVTTLSLTKFLKNTPCPPSLFPKSVPQVSSPSLFLKIIREAFVTSPQKIHVTFVLLGTYVRILKQSENYCRANFNTNKPKNLRKLKQSENYFRANIIRENTVNKTNFMHFSFTFKC